MSSCKLSDVFVRLQEKLEFLDLFIYVFKFGFPEIRLVGAGLKYSGCEKERKKERESV